jgi:hypothetical protein
MLGLKTVAAKDSMPKLFTHFVKRPNGQKQTKQGGFIYLRESLQFWVLPSLPFPLPACPPKPLPPKIVGLESWPDGVTVHGATLPSGVYIPPISTVHAMAMQSSKGKVYYQFHFEGRKILHTTAAPTVMLYEPQEKVVATAKQKVEEAEAATVAANTKFLKDVEIWAADRK